MYFLYTLINHFFISGQNFKVAVKLLHPPPSPRGSEGFDKMECNICENVSRNRSIFFHL